MFGGGAEFVSAGSPVFHILMTFELTIKIYAGSAGIAALFGGYNLFQITALLYYFGMPYWKKAIINVNTMSCYYKSYQNYSY